MDGRKTAADLTADRGKRRRTLQSEICVTRYLPCEIPSARLAIVRLTCNAAHQHASTRINTRHPCASFVRRWRRASRKKLCLDPLAADQYDNLDSVKIETKLRSHEEIAVARRQVRQHHEQGGSEGRQMLPHVSRVRTSRNGGVWQIGRASDRPAWIDRTAAKNVRRTSSAKFCPASRQPPWK
jgi:hypothetical protein